MQLRIDTQKHKLLKFHYFNPNKRKLNDNSYYFVVNHTLVVL